MAAPTPTPTGSRIGTLSPPPALIKERSIPFLILSQRFQPSETTQPTNSSTTSSRTTIAPGSQVHKPPGRVSANGGSTVVIDTAPIVAIVKDEQAEQRAIKPRKNSAGEVSSSSGSLTIHKSRSLEDVAKRRVEEVKVIVDNLGLAEIHLMSKNGEVKRCKSGATKFLKTYLKNDGIHIKAAELDTKIRQEITRYIANSQLNHPGNEPESPRGMNTARRNTLVFEGQTESTAIINVISRVENCLEAFKQHILITKCRSEYTDRLVYAMQSCLPVPGMKAYRQASLLCAYDSLYPEGKKVIRQMLSLDKDESKLSLEVLRKWSKITTHEEFMKESPRKYSEPTLSPYVEHEFYENIRSDKFWGKGEFLQVVNSYAREKMFGYTAITINGEVLQVPVCGSQEKPIELQQRLFEAIIRAIYAAGIDPEFARQDEQFRQKRIQEDVRFCLAKAHILSEEEYVKSLSTKPEGLRQKILEKFAPLFEQAKLVCTRFVDSRNKYQVLTEGIEKIWQAYDLVPAEEPLAAGCNGAFRGTDFLLRKLHPNLAASPYSLRHIRPAETYCDFQISSLEHYSVTETKWYGMFPLLFPEDPNRFAVDESKLKCELEIVSTLSPFKDPKFEDTFVRRLRFKTIYIHVNEGSEHNFIIDNLVNVATLKDEDISEFCTLRPIPRKS